MLPAVAQFVTGDRRFVQMRLTDEALVLGYQLMYRCGIIKTVMMKKHEIQKGKRVMNTDNTVSILKNKLFLYLTEFFAGMSVMAVELGANRLLAPYFSNRAYQ